MDARLYRALHPREYQRRFQSRGVRADGRSLLRSRKLQLTTGSIGTALGSAMVKLGNTKVIAGVTGQVVEDKDEGEGIEVEVQMVGSGKGSRERREVGEVVAEWVNDMATKWVDIKRLVAVGGKLRWRLKVGIYCLDWDGALEDAVVLVVVASLRDVLLPTVTMREDGDDDEDMFGEADRGVLATASEDRMLSLGLEKFSVAVTFALFDGALLMDPTKQEEEVCDAKFTVVFNSSGVFQSIRKSGGAGLSQEHLDTSIAHAETRVPQLVSALMASTKNS